MIFVVLYAVVNILLSAFAGKRKRWKLTAAVHGVMLTLVLGVLAVYALSASAADLVSALTGNRANVICELLDATGGAFTLAPIVAIEVTLLIQAVLTGLFAAIAAVVYIKGKLAGHTEYVHHAVKKTVRRAEQRENFAPLRRLWQMNCVMNC